MKKTLLSVALLLSTVVTAYAWEQKPNKPIAECAAQLPFGVPTTAVPNTTVLCHTAYATLHDNNAKIPIWVAYTLTPKNAIGCVARTNAFVATAAIPKGQRAELGDYAKSGYDQGHLAPDGDMSWDQQVEYESFLLSNMSPQLPNLNRGIWKSLESNVRAWTYGNNQNYTIYAGNIYTKNSKTIGENKVVVPDYLYKIIINNATKEVLAFRFEHLERQEINLVKNLTSVADLEGLTGIKFPCPPGHDKTKAAVAIWPVDLKKTADAKKAQCKS